jgi:nucleoside-diphosphate-sugar epimerase
MAEHHLLSIGGDELDPCILRLATLYGLSPRMRFDLAINRMTASGAVDGQVTVYGGGQWRPFVHVRDAAGVMICALTAHSQPTTIELYNCGSEEYRLLDAGNIICRTIGNADLVVFEESADTRSYRVDPSAIFGNLGYIFENSLVGGIKEIAETLKDPAYPDFRGPVFDNVPLTEEFAAADHADQKVAVGAGSSGG